MPTLAIRGLIVAFVLALTFYVGYHARAVVAERDALSAQTALDQAVIQVAAEQAKNQALAAKKTSDSTSRIDAQEPQQQIVTRTVTQQVIKYVQSPDHGKCAVPADWVRAYNDSLGVSAASAVPAPGLPVVNAAVTVPAAGVGAGHGNATDSHTK